ALDGVARHLDVIHVGGGGDSTGQHDQTRVAQRFGRDTRVGGLGQDGVQDGVGNLVGDFVGMTFGNRFGCKQEIVICHSDASFKTLVAQQEVERNALHLGRLLSSCYQGATL